MGFERNSGRKADELRTLKVTPGFIDWPGPAGRPEVVFNGSALIEAGKTRVICTAMVQDGVPPWLRGKGSGWVTAEYSMLPASTPERTFREAVAGKQKGRTLEIQRLVGRSLRSVVDLYRLGDRTVMVDCDVIQADGGTRCASVSGAYVALHLALKKLVDEQYIPELPLTDSVAAVSVGICEGEPVLDLDYREDNAAEVDMNVVMTGSGKLVEVQATAEGAAFGRDALDRMIDLAAGGIETIAAAQLKAVAG
ncbi:MAG: ribonuclease PH [Gaiellales bacterium]|nr:MAG: ribonuclease PH [Gaiellales bacterium]